VIVVFAVLFIVGSSGSGTTSTSSPQSSAPAPVVSQRETPAVTPKAPSPTTPLHEVPANQVVTPVSKQVITTPVTAPVPPSTPIQPPLPAASWHKVTTYSGSSSLNTDAFIAKGSKWRINWSITPETGTEAFCKENQCSVYVGIYKDDGTVVDQFLATGTTTTNGVSYEYGKTGNFYFHVVQGNVSWTLTVEDYY
jgi:hypothetical protein